MKILWQQTSPKKKINRRLSQEKTKAVTQLPWWNFNPRLMTQAGVALLLVVVASAVWLKLMDPQTLPLQQVRLEAPFEKVSKEQIHEVVSAQINGGFFSVDVAAVTEAVKAMPWVDVVEVRRVWPDALHVTVKEQVPLARWRDQALVNVRGELFYPPADSFPVGMVELRGPDNSVANMAHQFSIFNQALGQAGLGMKSLVLSQRRAWELELADSLTVALGRSNTEMRLQRFVRFYPQLLDKAENVKRIDMRYTNGFAVQWRV